MKIAILSDSHDHIWNLEKVVEEIKDTVETVIHCGDVIAPFSSKILAKTNLPTYVCLGNNDEDHIGMQKNGNNKFTWTHVGQQYAEIELGGKKLAYTHFAKLGELLAKSGDYDAVFHGHTHEVRNETLGEALLLNPGSICGIIGGKSGQASYAIYDTKTNTAKIITI